MKKLLLGLLIGVVITIPTTVFAEKLTPDYPPAVDILETNFGWNQYADSARNGISTFNDAGNKCYVVYDRGGGYASISCVKAQP